MSVYYCIVHKADGFLPVCGKPSLSGPTQEGVPRLFPSKRSAAAALSAWLRGPQELQMNGEGDWPEITPLSREERAREFSGYVERVKEDMSIIPVKVVILGTDEEARLKWAGRDSGSIA